SGPTSRPRDTTRVPVGKPASPPPALRAPADSSSSHQPVDLPPGHWSAPPPVRRRKSRSEDRERSDEHDDYGASYSEPHRPASRRLSGLLLVLIPLLVLGALGAAGWYAYTMIMEDEGRVATAAQKDFDEGRFPAAASKFTQLATKFPDSPRASEYRF